MKITIEYVGSDEKFNAAAALVAPQLYSALVEINAEIRKRLKYGDLGPGETDELKGIRDLLPIEVLEFLGSL